VCAREKEGRLKGLCLLFYELVLYVGFLWGRALLIVPELASSVIPMLACIWGPGALKPGSSGLLLINLWICMYRQAAGAQSWTQTSRAWQPHRPSALQRVTYATVPPGQALRGGGICPGGYLCMLLIFCSAVIMKSPCHVSWTIVFAMYALIIWSL